MTITKTFTLALVVISFSNAIATPSNAFMIGGDNAATIARETDLAQTIELIRQELKAGQTNCNQMLDKIDSAIGQIDAALDTGVADEAKYLGLRDELVEMRLTLPCLTNELARQGTAATGEIAGNNANSTGNTSNSESTNGGIAGDNMIGTEPLMMQSSGTATSAAPTQFSSGAAGAGANSGSIASGSSGFASLAAFGALTATSFDSNSNDPGTIASPSN